MKKIQKPVKWSRSDISTRKGLDRWLGINDWTQEQINQEKYGQEKN